MKNHYKTTLNLPKTTFPMKGNLPQLEKRLLKKWNQEELYQKHQQKQEHAPLFVLHDGPPFTNGDVHLGTALNKVLKDFVVKSKSMLGYRAPFLPGWDCHGLPIELKVMKHGKEYSYQEVRSRCRAYSNQYSKRMENQFRRLGLLADWENAYRTQDFFYEAKQLRCFAELVRKGLVYQATKPVLWSSGAQSALAESEVEKVNTESTSVYVQFELQSPDTQHKMSAVAWTTTPWTLVANEALAVNPKFTYVLGKFKHVRHQCEKRLLLEESQCLDFSQKTDWAMLETLRTFKGKDLTSYQAKHPFLEKYVPLVTAHFVDHKTGTGVVHVAPGFGPDDYKVGLENKLLVSCPVNEHGCFTNECDVKAWVGKNVFKTNALALKKLHEHGNHLGEHAYQHAYPHCWRTQQPLFYRAVKQFFVNLEGLKHKALEKAHSVTWTPTWAKQRFTNTLLARTDWCLSRQRVWGVPLPVYYNSNNEPVFDPTWVERVADYAEKNGCDFWFSMSNETFADTFELPLGFKRSYDTMDVWMDSGLSHLTVLDTHPDLHSPADLYLEATDQHRGWFQSSMLSSVALKDCAPFKQNVTHGWVLNGSTFEKESKSQGANSVEALCNEVGADVVRLWVSSVNYTEDLPYTKRTFQQATTTYRKVRNTFRFLLANLNDFDQEKDSVEFSQLRLLDRWVLDKLSTLKENCQQYYDQYMFNKAHSALVETCTYHLSNLYFDVLKDTLYCDSPNSLRRRSAQTVFHHTLQTLVQLWAPVLPFTTEEVWESTNNSGSVHLELFDTVSFPRLNKDDKQWMDWLLQTRTEVNAELENKRKQLNLSSSLECQLTLHVQNANFLHKAQTFHSDMVELFMVNDVTLVEGSQKALTLNKTKNHQCPRCWKYDVPVMTSEKLCERCQSSLES